MGRGIAWTPAAISTSRATALRAGTGRDSTRAPAQPYNVGEYSDIVVVKLDRAGPTSGTPSTAAATPALAKASPSTSTAIFISRATALRAGTGRGLHRASVNAHSGGTADIVVVKLDSDGPTSGTPSTAAAPVTLAVARRGRRRQSLRHGRQRRNWSGPGGCTTPGTSPCPLHAFSGSRDIVVVKLDSDGAYQWHTFYGDRAITLAVASPWTRRRRLRHGLQLCEWNGPGTPPAPPLNPYNPIMRASPVTS